MTTRALLSVSILGAAAFAPAVALAQKAGGDVVITMVQAPPSLDAHVSSAQVARNVNLHMFETLYARDESAKPVPDLATGVDISADGLTYVFSLRDGVKFHNGATLDANDVVLSYGVQWDAAHPLHVGRTGEFSYFSGLFGGFLNAPAAE